MSNWVRGERGSGGHEAAGRGSHLTHHAKGGLQRVLVGLAREQTYLPVTALEVAQQALEALDARLEVVL